MLIISLALKRNAMNSFYTFLTQKIKNITPILLELKKQNATVYLVGGAARDLFMKNADSKKIDLDLEVHGIDLEKLQDCLNSFSPTSLVGKSFGVLKMFKHDIDWSIPRQDSMGRKPVVKTDPNLGIEKALQRRDITINAIAINLTEVAANFNSIKKSAKTTSLQKLKELKKVNVCDPFNGLRDLKKKIINPVDVEKFSEDPLRFFRVMRFIAQFDFKTSKSMDSISKKMDISSSVIAKERISQEFEKMIVKGKNIYAGLAWLKKIGRLKDCFAELESILRKKGFQTFLKNLQQINLNKIYYFFTCISYLLSSKEESLSFAKKFSISEELSRQGLSLGFFAKKTALAKLEKQSDYSLKKIAHELSTIKSNFEILFTFLQLIDKASSKKMSKIKKRCTELKISTQPIAAVVTGDDLKSFIKASPVFGEILKKCYEMQLKKPAASKQELINYGLNFSIKTT